MKNTHTILFVFLSWFAHSQTEEIKVFDSKNSPLNVNKITSTEEDLRGNVWIGTVEGLFIFNGKKWAKLNKENSQLPSNKILCVKHHKNKSYIGTSEGLVVVDGSWTTYNTNNSRLPSNKIRKIEVDNKNNLWIATSAGLCVFNDGFQIKLSKEKNNIINDDFICLKIDRAGKKWVATNKELYSFENDIWRVYTLKNSKLPKGAIWTLEVDFQNRLWVGTKQGVATCLENQWSVFDKKNSPIKNTPIKSLFSDSYDRVWIGTEKGLFTFDGYGWEKERKKGHLKNIEHVYVDQKDNKWIVTSEALLVYNKEGVELKEEIIASK